MDKISCKKYVEETWNNNDPESFEGWLEDNKLSVKIIVSWLLDQAEYDEETGIIKDIINGDIQLLDPENYEVLYEVR